ncbi:MAG: hypothetical protein E7466_00910 [Ruminococcaceae bacterium]|nr:hypothetical protein [Oscillospiraceae bacterium]
MERFQAQKGFAHLVFGESKDSYILPGLVRLELNGYLYCLLKKRGYQNVFFISGLDGSFRLELCDQTSRETYQRLMRKSGFWNHFSPEDGQERSYALPDGKELSKRLINILKKSKDTAFVVRLDTFAEVFGSNLPELKEFVRTGQKYLEQSGNVLLLQLPVTAGGSMKYLTDSKGIFSDMDGLSLCPEVALIQSQGHNVKLYEQLARDMGERCVFLNEMTLERIRLAVAYIFVTTHPDWSWDEPQLASLSAFVHRWYHSAALRRRTGPILSENAAGRLETLLEDLADESRLLSLRQWMEDVELEQYPLDDNRVLVQSDGLLARKIKQIRIPEELYSTRPEQGKLAVGKFHQLAREYQTPRSQPCDPELEKQLMQCLFSLETAANKGDTETFERAVKFLTAGVERDFRYQESERKIWKYQQTILRLSEDAFKLEGLIHEDTDQILLHTRSKKELIRQIEAEKSTMGSGILRGVTAQEHALSVKMHEAVDLDKLIDNRTRSRAVKQERRNQCLTTLHDLELAVGSLGLGIGRDVEAVYRDALNAMEREAVAHQRSETTLQELGSSMDFVMQEMPGKSDDTDLLEEYEKMLGSLEDEPLILLD